MKEITCPFCGRKFVDYEMVNRNVAALLGRGIGKLAESFSRVSGNAVVPQIPELIGRWIIDAMKAVPA